MTPKYAGYRLAQWLSERLPGPMAFRCAEHLADWRWRCSASDRAAVEANLSRIMEAPPAERSRAVREVFRNFGRYLVEFFAMTATPQPEVAVEGYHHLTSAHHPSRGTIILTAHVGNWELGATVIRRMGFPVSAVALPHADPRMDRLFNGQRQRCGITVIPLGERAMRRSLQSLQEGQLLGMLGDRDFAGNGVVGSFCGATVRLPRGPAILSLRGRAPILPTFLIREGRWKFRLWIEPPLWPTSHHRGEEAIRTLTQAYAAVIERYIRRFPDQWLMFQPMLGVG